MKSLTNFHLTEVDNTAGYSAIELEPLEAGYGHTLGNSLRRVMLTSLSGYAITDVKIEGVSHQFTTLEGLSEDIVDLILNLKQVRITSDLKTEGVCTLKIKGKQHTTVTAADIECEAGFQVVNSDLYIATLEPSASLSVEMKIGFGTGYSLASDRKSVESGLIPVDALYSPVIKVAYDVEATRVGRRTDFDKLILRIWTDGTISPRQAIEEAAEILVGQFQQILHPAMAEEEKRVDLMSPEKAEVLKLTVEELDLPTRIANALRKGGYATVGDLIVVEMGIVAKVKNLGEKSVGIVQKALLEKGVDFSG
ncbi:MAG: DNA-directed RNA polymerase subunit alpha [Patescibacteria group bacterium]